jgi:Fe-S cluster assembly protein SufD
MKSFQIQLGADFSRSESVSDLIGTGARSDMLSVSMPLGDQVVDQRTLQKHKAPHASSDLLYKNALYDNTRTIFSGLIIVDEGAHYTDAYQTNRNLLNSKDAEATSMPGLEINADQVKCSHGATSGPVSDDELFYLKARGIPDHEARKLIVLGFIEDTVKRLGNEAVETMICQRLEEKFERVV